MKKTKLCLFALPILLLSACGGQVSSTPVAPASSVETPASEEPSSTPISEFEGIRCNLNIVNKTPTYGTITASKTENIAVGDEITLTMTPTSNLYALDYLKIDFEDVEVTGNTYTFTINTDTEVEVSFKSLAEISSPVLSFNRIDSEFSVWTSDFNGGKGITLHTPEGWGVYGWRTIIIVDAEGYIMYAVHNPNNGYGGAGGVGYYTNTSKYSYLDVKSLKDADGDGAYDNIEEIRKAALPCYELLDGWGKWTQEKPAAANKYNIILPEGCWAITGHQDKNTSLFDFLKSCATTTPTLTLDDDEPEKLFSKNFNSSNNQYFSDNLRLQYDGNKNVIGWHVAE